MIFAVELVDSDESLQPIGEEMWQSLIVVIAVFFPQPSNGFSITSLRLIAQNAQESIIPKFHRSSLLRMVATDMPKVASGMSGMFTNSSPDTKRVVPTNMEGKTRFKIVYVVLESQYQSSLTKACETVNAGKEGVAIEAVGYLLEELRNPVVLEQFKADVAEANIFIGSLIFVQELADKVQYAHPPIFCAQLSSNRFIVIGC